MQVQSSKKCVRVSIKNRNILRKIAEAKGYRNIGNALNEVFDKVGGDKVKIVSDEIPDGQGTTIQIDRDMWVRLHGIRMESNVRSINSIVTSFVEHYLRKVGS